MALPFILGLAVGAGVVVAVSKSDKIINSACSLFKKSKNAANDSIEKSKDVVGDFKETINATAQCIKDKKAQLKEEKTVTQNNLETQETKE